MDDYFHYKTPISVQIASLSDYLLLIEFDDGETRYLDVKPFLERSWFLRLRDQDFFKKVHADGCSISWDGVIGISPEEVWHNSTVVV